MRLGIISDIHANLEALTQAFLWIDTHAIDEVVCLGDIVGYGANPNECIDLIRSRCALVVRGNHDEAMLHTELTETFTENARSSAAWTRKQLSAGSMEFLRSLPYKASRHNLFFVHASPDQPEEWTYILNEWDAQPLFDFFSEQCCFIGHTHHPVKFSLSGKKRITLKNDRFIINIGSIGQPRDGDPRASFGVLDTDTWRYQNIRIAYDIPGAAKKIEDANLPMALARRLFVGR